MSEIGTADAVDFEGATPIFRVQNLQHSIEYYIDVLGFKLKWQASDDFACVSRGRCSLMLCEGGQGCPGTWVWIGVTDAEALFNEYQSKGAKVRSPPTNYPWAYEMHVEDLDGHVLRLGSEPKTDTE